MYSKSPRRGLSRSAWLVCLSGPLLLAACGGETEPAAVSTFAAAARAPAPAAAAHAEVIGAQLFTQSDALA